MRQSPENVSPVGKRLRIFELNVFSPCQNSISAKLKVKKRSTFFDFSKNAFDAKVMQVMHVIEGIDSISAQTLA